MQIIFGLAAILLGYILGSVPFGLLVVKIKTGKDIREVESGRTGGTNALRAAGFWAGLATALLDISKGFVAVWLARHIVPEANWAHMLSAISAIIGHNHSIFLPERDENGKLIRLRGGAGGAPSVGGAMGLWPASILIILPLGALVFFTVGIASVTTISVALFAIIVFAISAAKGALPWAYVLYGVGAEFLLMWALRPNLKKLLQGNERVVSISLNGWLRSKRQKEAIETENNK